MTMSHAGTVAIRTLTAFVASAAIATCAVTVAVQDKPSVMTITHPFVDECRQPVTSANYDPNDPEWWPVCGKPTLFSFIWNDAWGHKHH